MKCQFVETTRPWFGFACDADAEWVTMWGNQKRRVCNIHFEMMKHLVLANTDIRIGDSAYPIEDEETFDAQKP